jgi:hypothetical protein
MSYIRTGTSATLRANLTQNTSSVKIGPLADLILPPGFMQEQPPGSAAPRSDGPDGLLDIDRKDNLWELTIEGLYKVKWLIDDNYVSHGIVPIDAPERRL